MRGFYKNFLCLFIIVLFCSCTPVSAVQMEQVAHEAEQYNKDSQKEMGFFARLAFTAKGFKLLDKVEKAQKEVENQKNGKKSYFDDYNDLAKENNQQALNRALLAVWFKKHVKDKETQQNNSTEAINKSSLTETDNGLSVPISEKIRQLCISDADKIIQLLAGKSVLVSQSQHLEVNDQLNGRIVQLNTKTGELYYAQVKKMNLKDSGSVTLITSSGSEKTLSLADFKRAYTGTTLNINPGDNVGVVLSDILALQKDELNKQNGSLQSAYNNAKKAVMKNLLTMTVGVALIFVGVILMLWFGQTQAAIASSQAKNTLTETERIVLNKIHAYDPEGIVPPGQVPCQWWVEVDETGRTLVTQTKEVPPRFISHFKGRISPENLLNYIEDGKVYVDGFGSMSSFGFATAQSALEASTDLATQNYIKLTLRIVGIILAFTGLATIIYGSYQVIEAGLIMYNINKALKNNRKRMNARDEWPTDKGDTLPLNTTVNSKAINRSVNLTVR